MNNTEKLIIGRAAIKEYKTAFQIKGCKTQSDSNKLHSILESLGFDISSFYAFSFDMNLKEVDKCFRFRRTDTLSKPALCDSCVGRSIIPCYQNAVCAENGLDYTTIFDAHTPDMLFQKEQEEEAVGIGITPAFYPRAINHFLLAKCNYTMPGYCIGQSHQIEIPAFDVLWNMEQIIDFGYVIYQEFLKKNGVTP